MYKHYETSNDVFVDREEHIKWMNDALERCKEIKTDFPDAFVVASLDGKLIPLSDALMEINR